MNNRRGKRVYAFIDSQNVNVSTQKFGWKMDWRKFRRFLKDKYGVTNAYMFIGYVPENQDMYEFLHDAGYSVVLKPTFDMSKPYKTKQPTEAETPKETADDESYKSFGEQAADLLTPPVAEATAEEQSEAARKSPVKGNVDAELVLWAMKELKNYDKALIISGDGDFFCLVEYLQQQGKLLKVLPPNVHYSSLYRQYEKYIDHLGNYRRELAYRDRRRSAKK